MPGNDRIGVKLLVIDDAQEEASLYGWYLSKVKKYLVDIDYADNGKKGIDKLQKGEYDIVFCDYRMPIMDGLTVLSEMQKRGFSIPLVLLTGQGDETVAANAIKLGALDYVKKRDLPKLDFSALLDRAMERRRTKDDGAELAEFERLRTALFSDLSAELRSTLENVRKLEEGLPKDGRPAAPDLDRSFRSMKQSAIGMEATIEDLNNLKSLLNPQSHNPRPVALNQLLDAGVARKKPLLDAMGVRIETVFPEADVRVRADPDAIQVVLENLLSNAVQFTPTGGSIAVHAERFSSGAVRVGVRNSGVGAGAGSYARLHVKADEAPATGSHHLGLGLRICRKIVENHGGRLWLETDPQGATAFLTLPGAAKS